MKMSSKQKIKAAFVELIETKGLESTTITDITRKAGINRGTFYLSYADKYELLYTLENEIINSVFARLENLEIVTGTNRENLVTIEDWKEQAPFFQHITIKILEIIYQERRLICALLSDKGDPSFLTQFKKEVFHIIFHDGFFCYQKHDVFAQMPDDYLREIVLNGVVTVIVHWLSKDCLDPIEDIANILNFTNFAAPTMLSPVTI